MIISFVFLLNRWFHFLPSWCDYLMWLVYIWFVNDSILLLYKFLEPKYHFLIEFNTINLQFPFGYQSMEPRKYFKMDMRKKIGTYSVLVLMVYSLYIDNLVMFCSCVIIPILLHILMFKFKNSILS